MWPDKTEESARNNRGVPIKKLRKFLEQLDGVQIVNESSIWRLNLEKEAICDFNEVRLLLLKRERLEYAEIIRLLENRQALGSQIHIQEIQIGI